VIGKFVILILVAWIVLMLGLKSFAALLRRQTEKATRNAIHPEKILRIVDNASYLGAQFPGPNLPPRTSGVLALTESRLFFLPWYPRKSITLPRNSIDSVKSSSSFDGKTYSIPALVFTVEGVGVPGAREIAWLVQDPEGWKGEIESILVRGSMKEK
jgi:hypothetical protein